MDRLFEKSDSLSIDDLREGGFFLVDKPQGWTSFDIVNKLRYAIRRQLGLKRYKIGHAGTLDPLATGLLIICFSKYTKQIESFMGLPKSYDGTIRLWQTTPCYDAELEVDTYYPQTRFSIDQIEEVRASFLGTTEQFPPVFSAIKKNGVPMYKLARDGKRPEMKSRTITITKMDVTRVDLPNVDVSIDCSKGTYIRSIAHDFGQKLGSGAYLSALRRTKIGDYDVRGAWSIGDLCTYIDSLSNTEASDQSPKQETAV